MNSRILSFMRSALALLGVLALALVVSFSYITANAGTTEVVSTEQSCVPCDPSDCPVPCTGPCDASTPKCCVERPATVQKTASASSCEPCPMPCKGSGASACTPTADVK